MSDSTARRAEAGDCGKRFPARNSPVLYQWSGDSNVPTNLVGREEHATRRLRCPWDTAARREEKETCTNSRCEGVRSEQGDDPAGVWGESPGWWRLARRHARRKAGFGLKRLRL